MIPQTTQSYLAMSRNGRVVASFDTPEAATAFAESKSRQNVRLQLVSETITRAPLNKNGETA